MCFCHSWENYFQHFGSGIGFSSVESEPDATLNYITGEQGSYANEQGKRTFSFEHLYIRGLLNVLSLHQVYYCIRSNVFGRYLESPTCCISTLITKISCSTAPSITRVWPLHLLELLLLHMLSHA